MQICDYCGYECVSGTPCVDPEETQGCSNMEDRHDERRRGVRLIAWTALALLGFCLWTALIAGVWRPW